MSGPDGTRFLPLIYHDILTGDAAAERTAVENRPYRIPRGTFEAHVGLLRERGFESVTSAQVLCAIRREGRLPRRSVLITFDDGHVSNYTGALPVLLAHGFRALFFVTTDWVGTPGMMTWAQIGEMAERGMEIGSHTATHPIPTLLRREELADELARSRSALESRLGRPIVSLSSPTGFHDPRMRRLAAEAGYRVLYVGATTPFGRALAGQDPYWVNRIDVKAGLPLDAFARLLDDRGSVALRLRSKEYVLGLAKSLMGARFYNGVRKEILGRLG